MPTRPPPLAGLNKSKLWKALESFLRDRREVTILRPAKTVDEMWRREGALLEINMLLRLPEIAAAYEIPQLPKEGEDATPHPPLDVEEWN